jgi:hypothetical protein
LDKQTVDLIRAIQLKVWGAHAVTGTWTPQIAALVSKSNTIGTVAMNFARTQVGVHEMPPGSNDGPRVRVYQATTGAYKAPWCASFVTWSFLQAGKKLTGFNTAYCPSWVNAARAGRNSLSLVARQNVVPGDCVLFDWNGDGTADHIGIVTSKVSSTGNFTTVEGNTSGPGGDQSNGGEVWKQNRNACVVLCFVRVSP